LCCSFKDCSVSLALGRNQGIQNISNTGEGTQEIALFINFSDHHPTIDAVLLSGQEMIAHDMECASTVQNVQWIL
jgi:hypothetical protein